jgi:tRNA G10  N-methylase Trm11
MDSGALHRGRLRPEHCFDLAPRHDFVRQVDCRALPLADASAGAIAFDPPFLAGGGNSGVMHEKYSSYPSMPALYQFYDEALREFFRVLSPGGFLVFKCQDLLNGRSQGFTHCEIYNAGIRSGFYACDLFVLVNRNRMTPHNLKRQVHARKATCYYWVFKKSERKNHRMK